jgi:uncharacterized secreted protein with C-terminal beta-propeller domain
MRWRRNLTLAIAAALALSLIALPQAIGRPADGQDAPAPRVMAGGVPLRLDPAPIVSDGTLLAPVRPVAEWLGASVTFRTGLDGKRTIILSRDGKQAEFVIGSKSMIVDGAARTLPAAPMLRNGSAMVPLRAVAAAFGEKVVWEPGASTAHLGSMPELPVVGTAEKLREILKSAWESSVRYGIDFSTAAEFDFPTAESATAGSADSSARAGQDYSRTNVQVEGVDEADWAKTDGRFIYQISGSRVLVADIRNPETPRLAAVLDYADDEARFQPKELYVSNGRLVVIGTAYRSADPRAAEGDGASRDAAAGARDIWIWPPSFTSARVYALNEDGEASLVRELEMEGHYVTSRMIGGALYMVASKSNHVFYPMKGGDPEIRPQDFEPAWRDTAVSDDMQTIPLTRLRYFPDSPEDGTLLIGAVDLDDADAAFRVEAYLGSAGTVYASAENLYIAVPISTWPEKASDRKRHVEPELSTDLYKFRLNGGSAVYAGQGSVPGHVLNQFSMDEYDGHFRIATTSGHLWATGDAISKNNLYVLDGWLRKVGSLENLAPGERIYSVRFMGNRAYLVTFRQVDPLFAIDLSDPKRPAVLGQLKIPGYSDYLHPYDENHLIGFGKETIVSSSRDERDEPMAYHLGMKMSLFDVTDVTQPKELFKEVIGDRGTQSELLYNHKALLFDRERGLMAFPVELAVVDPDVKAQWDGYGPPPYGEFRYQGAYVYRVDPENGFVFMGRITHLTEEDLAKSGTYGYDPMRAVRRILYAGDTLYTLSDAMLKANAIDTLAERGSLRYPEPANAYKGFVRPGGRAIFDGGQ